MRAAPPVTLRLASCRLEAACTRILFGLSGAVLAQWVVSWLAWDRPGTGHLFWVCVGVGLAVGLGALAGHVTAKRVWRYGGQSLAWAGQRWELKSDPPDARMHEPEFASLLQCHVDLGHWVLLSFERPERSGALSDRCWLIAARRADPFAWHAFRVALVHQPKSSHPVFDRGGHLADR